MIRKTSYESSRSFRKSLLLKPIAARAERAQEMYNQVPKDDAEFNRGDSLRFF